MPKRNPRNHQKRDQAAPQSSRRAVVIILCLVLLLSLIGGIFAQWRAAHIARRHPMLAPAPTVASAGSPSKEYIYAGGKLIATEEPAASASSAPPPANTRTNVALATSGGVASASSVAGSNFGASAANNGDERGLNWGAGGGWLDSPPQYAFPDWLQIDFNGTKSVDEIDIFSIQDSYSNPSEPTPTMTFSLYGLTGFSVQYWDGSAWVNVPTGNVSGNNLVWKKLTFSAVTTNKIRVLINASVDGWSRLAEVEAWGYNAVPVGTNVALATNGGIASASSVAGSGFKAGAVNNGDNKGLNWGAGGGWLDAPPQYAFPDWLQVDFNGTKTIHQVDVFMVQDNYSAPTTPTQSMTFTHYGLTDFKVQYWNGSAWADIPGASATGNNMVWKRFSFSDITTSKIRLLCVGSADGWSRVVELEAWGN